MKNSMTSLKDKTEESHTFLKRTSFSTLKLPKVKKIPRREKSKSPKKHKMSLKNRMLRMAGKPLEGSHDGLSHTRSDSSSDSANGEINVKL